MISRFWVNGVRNLTDKVVELRSPFLVIFGENNQGKTNLLESLFFCFRGKSPVESDKTRLIGFGRDSGYVGADIVGPDGDFRVYCKISGPQTILVTLDSMPLKSFQKLKRLVRISYFSADVLRLFQDAPEVRRRELDGFASVVVPGAQAVFRRYEQALRQKNRLLKTAPEPDRIRLWNTTLSALAAEVISYRLEALKVLQDRLDVSVPEIFPEYNGKVLLNYVYRSDYPGPFSVDTYVAWLTDKFESGMDKEIALGYSLYGPSRDDFVVMIENRSLYHFYSRGVNRALAILIKFAQVSDGRIPDSDSSHGAGRPILLLDDTFSELHFKLKLKLAAFFESRSQVFLTTVLKEDQSLVSSAQLVTVQEGTIVDEVLSASS